jgi:hypothetical protein
VSFSDEVYEEFGRTADLAQAFECELGTAILTAEAGRAGLFRAQDPEAASRILDAIDARTLGASLKVFRKTIEIPGEVEALFERALTIRNRLMHGFFLRRFPRALQEGGNERTAQELRLDRAELERARAEAEKISEQLMESLRDS